MRLSEIEISPRHRTVSLWFNKDLTEQIEKLYSSLKEITDMNDISGLRFSPNDQHEWLMRLELYEPFTQKLPNNNHIRLALTEMINYFNQY